MERKGVSEGERDTYIGEEREERGKERKYEERVERRERDMMRRGGRTRVDERGQEKEEKR